MLRTFEAEPDSECRIPFVTRITIERAKVYRAKMMPAVTLRRFFTFQYSIEKKNSAIKSK